MYGQKKSDKIGTMRRAILWIIFGLGALALVAQAQAAL
jgi:hypothetical protein